MYAYNRVHTIFQELEWNDAKRFNCGMINTSIKLLLISTSSPEQLIFYLGLFMMSMPIVSLISLQDSSECASNLLEAAQTLGFVYITSEGSNISTEKIDRMFQLVRLPSNYVMSIDVLTWFTANLLVIVRFNWAVVQEILFVS